MDCFVAGAPRNDGKSSGRFDRNTLFTILIDPVFTTFMRRAFTKAPDAARLGCAIA